MAEDFFGQLAIADTSDALFDALRSISAGMGFDYFALSHHVDLAQTGPAAIRLHNYPSIWAAYYEDNALGASDPVHRASHVTTIGFAWADIPGMIPLTAEDRRILGLGRDRGIGDGFTVPANIPGESLGSCTFANGVGIPLDAAMFPLAQLVGLAAFERARRIWGVRSIDVVSPRLTDRQRDCLIWAGRGKSDWETSRILGISEETVDRHLKHARERYGVPKRTSVLIHALFDGTLSFADVLKA